MKCCERTNTKSFVIKQKWEIIRKWKMINEPCRMTVKCVVIVNDMELKLEVYKSDCEAIFLDSLKDILNIGIFWNFDMIFDCFEWRVSEIYILSRQNLITIIFLFVIRMSTLRAPVRKLLMWKLRHWKNLHCCRAVQWRSDLRRRVEKDSNHFYVINNCQNIAIKNFVLRS